MLGTQPAPEELSEAKERRIEVRELLQSIGAVKEVKL